MALLYSPVLKNSPKFEDLIQLPTLLPFGDPVVGFVESFSKLLLSSQGVRRYPELAALAFWMRRSNLERLRDQTLDSERIYVARGMAFHVAPANVDTIFVYSWFISLLCGNSNVVRISSKQSPQSIFLFQLIGELLENDKYTHIRERSLVVQYGHESDVNDLFSENCDIRIIWGGDESVRTIRKSPLSATSCEMTFANKYSLCIIDAEEFYNASEKKVNSWVDGFCNDAFWFGQMACSSPRHVLWLGDGSLIVDKARIKFWQLVDNRMEKFVGGLDLNIADYVNKRVAVDSLALNKKIEVSEISNNDVVRVWLDEPVLHSELHCGAGLFFEGSISTLDDLIPLISRKIQTLSYIGITLNQWKKFLTNQSVAGIDRVVPAGKALDFDYVWDGYDMPKLLLREISLQ